ncbi:two-component regulator propeller domain-containing protein [Halpernia sp.]|uniref:helix-turn-helix and ligand-binding sensor domain-containing protein n=1 Tax=Halpernia sp. TaxID=2782209 RepID=UPI003A8D7ED3
MKIFQFFLFFLFYQSFFGQELPPIQKFSPENYLGDNQNWMISQAADHYIYVANNKGLLEYNGAKWTIYSSPNNTIMRAVNVIGNKIYTGCYADFGFWVKNEFGTLKYTSLLPKLHKKKLEDEQIWNILAYSEWVIFQSSNNLYLYNTKNGTFKIIKSTNTIYKVFKVNNRIYFHVANEGLYVLENGKPKLLVNNSVIKTGRVINVFKSAESLIILTRNSGFYKFQDNIFKKWDIPADDLLKKVNVFSSSQLEDGSLMIGTISDGIIHLSKNGILEYQISQKKGLSNNTVLSIFEDSANNVWVALDNGIDCINAKSAVSNFFDYEGVLGTVYTTQVFKNILYIGTNQGLFYKELKDVNNDFKFIEGTAGQVWDLFNLNDEYLFCGHHLGSFLIKNNKAIKISEDLGAWAFKKVPKHDDLLLQGNYNGLNVLENKNGSWELRNKIEGFKNSSRYFEINDTKQVWVNHEYKGVFKLQLNDNFTKVIKTEMEASLPLGKNSSLVKYQNNIYYASEKGIFKYNKIKKLFQRDAILSAAIKQGDYITGKLVVDKNGKLWAFSKDNICFIENDDITNTPIINTIPIPSKLRKSVLGYENISLINPNTYVLGTANGYIALDLSKISTKKDFTIYLNSIVLKGINDKITSFSLKKQGDLKYKQGVLIFNYSVPEFDKYLVVKYQYKLEGEFNEWSSWSENPQTTFENLSFGTYTFSVRAKIGNQLSKNIISYHFTVARPWYLSNVAFVLYILVLSLIILITHKTYKRYYNNKYKQKIMENEQALMKINNEKLNQDIDSKNRELAISTMSLIKKNEVLSTIKKELSKDKDLGKKAALNLIDTNLNDEDDWSFFETAFKNADKAFLDKIKKAHPDLTPNDLRFTAYLRLNLTSKEMAPLLNISIKSVETKRYRLRKKLGLPHDEGLINYILNLQ